jgi:4-hydroxythreonine-4-phosphate dehydrogenase
MSPTPTLALVAGEPAGVGPELVVRLAQQVRTDCHLRAYADPQTLIQAAAALGLPLALLPADARALAPGQLPLLPIPTARPGVFGRPDPANARAVIDALLAAGADCLAGRVDGVVTGPVHKAAINAGGIAYTGTTELLADQAGCPVVMMLANPTLRVALATTHLALRQVPDAITASLLEQVIGITHRALVRDFGIADPVIAVLGLNPHAGEDGVLGDEELRIINPLLERLRARGLRLPGPWPADTAFLPQRLAGIDAVLAMYHDQGLPVLKFSGFEQATNITLGLPYPRVAVDHGTALELAGKGTADPSSLFAAVDLCAALARQRKLSQ